MSAEYTSSNKRIAKNTAILYFRMLLVMGVSLYTSRVVLEALGIDDFGLYNVIGGLVTMFSFLNGALGSASSRFITFELGNNDPVKLNKIFNTTLGVHIALAVLIVILSEIFGLWLLYHKMQVPEGQMQVAFWVFQISVITCIFTLTQVPYNACIIAHENMTVYGFTGVVEAALKLAIAYMIMASPIHRLLYYAILLCLLQVGIMIYYRIYCRRYPETRLKPCTDWDLYRQIFKFSASDLIGQLSVLAQGQGLNILLNIFFGPAVNAARGIAYQVQGAVTRFTYNFFTAVKPQIIKLYACGKQREMMTLVYQSSWFSFYLMLMICLPLFIESNYLMHLWLKEVPEYTSSFLDLILILCLIQAIKTPRTTVFHATGHILLTNIFVGSMLCAAFPLAYVFLKCGMSPNSVFWASNITMFLSEFISTYLLKRYIDFCAHRYMLQIHLRCLIVGVLCYYIVSPLKHIDLADPVRLVLVCVASVIVVPVVAYIIGIDSDFRAKINHFVSERLGKLLGHKA